VTDLRIAHRLKLDPDYIGGGTLALLAKKGAGKTYAMRVLAEEFWKAKVPFVALDPMDAFWGLRSSANGEGEGIPVAVFGGPHGDAPLEKTGGKLMADLVVEEGLSMVLSTKHFGTRAAERQFAMDFLERLYRRNNELVHLLIDEADLFAPQKPNAGDQPLLAIAENIVRRGRNNGIGVTMASQRPAVLHKDVLNQVDGLVVMRLLGPRDRDAINDWVGEHGDVGKGREVKGTLPDLKTGEAWVWVPELGVLQRTTIRASRTFDSSPTRKRGDKAREPKSFADVDMQSIESKMSDTIERAKAEDPKELRKQIAAEQKRTRELERELEQRPTETQEVEVVVAEVPVLANGVVDKLGTIVEAIAGVAEGIRVDLARVADTAASRQNLVQGRERRPEERRTEAPRQRPRRGGERPAGAAPPAAEEDADLPPAARKFIETLVRHHPLRMTRAQMVTLSGYSRKSSTVPAAMTVLRNRDLIIERGGQFEPSEAAFQVLGEVPREPLSPDEVIDGWRHALRRTPAALAFFEVLLEAHPGGLTREELVERAGYSMSSSTVPAALTTLRRNGVIEEEQGEIRASEALFLTGVRSA
jgi:uncharacterized protein